MERHTYSASDVGVDATLRDFHVRESDLDEFKAACWEAAGCFSRPEEAERDIAALEAKLLAPPPIEVRLPLRAPRADEVDGGADHAGVAEDADHPADHADDADDDADFDPV